MQRKAIVVFILMLLTLGIVDARMPAVGDHVYIATSSSNAAYVGVKGEITDIGDGLICLRCEADVTHTVPYDRCVGVGSITSLTWI